MVSWNFSLRAENLSCKWCPTVSFFTFRASSETLSLPTAISYFLPITSVNLVLCSIVWLLIPRTLLDSAFKARVVVLFSAWGRRLSESILGQFSLQCGQLQWLELSPTFPCGFLKNTDCALECTPSKLSVPLASLCQFWKESRKHH